MEAAVQITPAPWPEQPWRRARAIEDRLSTVQAAAATGGVDRAADVAVADAVAASKAWAATVAPENAVVDPGLTYGSHHWGLRHYACALGAVAFIASSFRVRNTIPGTVGHAAMRVNKAAIQQARERALAARGNARPVVPASASAWWGDRSFKVGIGEPRVASWAHGRTVGEPISTRRAAAPAGPTPAVPGPAPPAPPTPASASTSASAAASASAVPAVAAAPSKLMSELNALPSRAERVPVLPPPLPARGERSAPRVGGHADGDGRGG